MTRSELAGYIKDRLIKENLIKDPVVTVEFMNLSVFVLERSINRGALISIGTELPFLMQSVWPGISRYTETESRICAEKGGG